MISCAHARQVTTGGPDESPAADLTLLTRTNEDEDGLLLPSFALGPEREKRKFAQLWLTAADLTLFTRTNKELHGLLLPSLVLGPVGYAVSLSL